MTTYTPRHRVTIRDLATNALKYDISSDVIAIGTRKAFGHCTGSWNIATTYRTINGKRYDQLIFPNDVVLIELDAGNGGGFTPVMLGLVDRPARVFNGGGDIPQRGIRISGRDMGKLLTGELGWDISGVQARYEYGLDSVQQSVMRRYVLPCGAPSALVKKIFEIFQAQIAGAYYPKYVDDAWVSSDDSWMIYKPELVGLRGTDAWSAFKRVANEPWNRLFCDTDDKGKFHLGLMKQPFYDDGRYSGGTWLSLMASDIILEDLGPSDCERVTLLCYWPLSYKLMMNNQIDIALADLDLTVVDQEAIKRHGVRPMIIETDFVPQSFAIDAGPKIDDMATAKTRAQTLWGWYKDNHLYESGTVICHGVPEIRAGAGLLLPERKMEYLIEQVSHSYAVHPVPSFTTALEVTRGQSHVVTKPARKTEVVMA